MEALASNRPPRTIDGKSKEGTEMKCWTRKVGFGLVLVLGMLVGLSSAGSTRAQGMLGPGGQINGLTLKAIDVGPTSVDFVDIGNCVRISDEPEPDACDFTVSRVCSVPLTENLVLESGWSARDAATLESNWSEIDWELSIDGQRVDLEAFGFSDYDRVDTIDGVDTTIRARTWRVAADALTTGIYKIQRVAHINQDIDDGFGITLAGTQTYEYYLRVGDAPPVELGMPTTGGSREGLPVWWLIGAFGFISLGLTIRAALRPNRANSHRRTLENPSA